MKRTTRCIRIFTRRVGYLDSLAVGQIRTEAERGALYSFRASAFDIEDVSIDPPGTKGAAGKAVALLSFTNQPTGKWQLELVTPKDTKTTSGHSASYSVTAR
jgi:hypothetical protein